jgi:hypothetical protein
MTSECAFPRRFERALLAILAAIGCLVARAPALAQVAELELSSSVFHEPSGSSAMTVIAPRASLAVTPWEFLIVRAGYEADVVSGASEPVKAGPLSSPDIISQASVEDVRHVVSGGFSVLKDNTTLSANYAFGTEKDYRSQSVTLSASTDFLQRNTQIAIAYARGFDEVCNLAYAPSLDPTIRARLDSSIGCFTDAANRQAQAIDLDTFQVAWTQSWTPVFATQLVLTGALQHGFLANPYRGVVIGFGGQVAQEHHPENRARNAAALRARYYLRPIQTAFGAGTRLYRDTWDVTSQSYELDAERSMLPWLRAQVRGRFYTQTGALFWSDDYTGGEPELGPRGQYWTGDRELSPLHNFSAGGRVLAAWKGRPGERVAGAFLDFHALASFDFIKTVLEEFTLAGEQPDDTLALVMTLGLGAAF